MKRFWVWEEFMANGRRKDVSELSDLAKMIELVAKMLVDLPDQVEVGEVEGENTTVVELKVAKSDIGKIIGKEGRTAKALRTILTGASTKLRQRTVLEIID
jgi:predicted RNA-binding protein YlqC (UPF0109 family)